MDGKYTTYISYIIYHKHEFAIVDFMLLKIQLLA